MKLFKAKGLYSNGTWLESVSIGVDAGGLIQSIQPQSANTQKEAAPAEVIDGWLLPGLTNAHSHAFQYAMAGLAEHLAIGQKTDTFWSWRESMYELALKITPDQFEAVAGMLYAEMLRMGYTTVVEFHYLHHDLDGACYANVAEMGVRLTAAAQKAGIGLTLVPIFYRQGDFGIGPSARQRRFISHSIEAYGALVDAIREALRAIPDGRMGVGMHSLRAVSKEDARDFFGAMRGDQPFHIHVSEQEKEVMACLVNWQARPVEWLLKEAPVNGNFNLVHATHINEGELKGIIQAGANVILCPSTEGNLGDGHFPLGRYMALGGRWCVGTDSHVGLNPFEELRWLDYGRRLCRKERNILCIRPGDDSGSIAFDQALENGRQAAGLDPKGGLAVGEPFDALVLDGNHPLLGSSPPERRLSTLVYASDPSVLKGTLRRGVWVVKDQVHVRRDEIRKEFSAALKALGNR